MTRQAAAAVRRAEASGDGARGRSYCPHRLRRLIVTMHSARKTSSSPPICRRAKQSAICPPVKLHAVKSRPRRTPACPTPSARKSRAAGIKTAKAPIRRTSFTTGSARSMFRCSAMRRAGRFSRLSRQTQNAAYSPQRRYVHFAPCHSPHRLKTMTVLSSFLPSPFRLPPRGI